MLKETERGMQKMQFHILSNRSVSVVFLSKIKRQNCLQFDKAQRGKGGKRTQGKIAPGPRLNSANHLLVKFCLHYLDLGSFIPKEEEVLVEED